MPESPGFALFHTTIKGLMTVFLTAALLILAMHKHMPAILAVVKAAEKRVYAQ